MKVAEWTIDRLCPRLKKYLAIDKYIDAGNGRWLGEYIMSPEPEESDSVDSWLEESSSESDSEQSICSSV
jgi:hypothetical protein